MASEDVVIFLHVPKTGGQTVKSILARQFERDQTLTFKDEVQVVPPERLRDIGDSIALIQGHFFYGVGRDLPRRYTYITLLREPIARVISLFRYAATTPEHPFYAQIKDLSLQEFLELGVLEHEIENGQTRQISGNMDRPTRSSLEFAKANLRKEFGAVGIVESFDESMMLFRNVLGWKTPFYVKKNVSSRDAASSAIDERGVALVRERNQLDLELYSFARNLFHDQKRQQGALFRAKVSAFKGANRLLALSRRGRASAS